MYNCIIPQPPEYLGGVDTPIISCIDSDSEPDWHYIVTMPHTHLRHGHITRRIVFLLPNHIIFPYIYRPLKININYNYNRTII